MANRLHRIFGRAARLLGVKTGIQKRGDALSLPGSANSSLPGFTPPAAGTFDTYRRMSSHPTIA